MLPAQEVRPGQVWESRYSVRYHVLACYEEWAWVLVMFAHTAEQPVEPL